MSSAISGSELSTAWMGGMCMTGPPRIAGYTPQHARVTRTRAKDVRYRRHGYPPDSEKADMATPIILDCDPGIDDALAIVFAHGHPGIDLLGLTTVAGNAGLAKTTVNALAVCEYIGAAGIPVTAGCAGPLLRPAFDARHVHGESGLGGAVLPPPVATAAPGHAVDYIIDTIGAARGEITLVATGPLTNIALAVKREPRLAGWVREFVIMGGSAGRGNVTPAAEYNVWADPEAAAAVFRAGWTVTELGLDVTMRTGGAAAVMERMRALGPLGAELLLAAPARHE